MKSPSSDIVQMIPVEQINVLNPRDRDRRKFQEVVDSIANVGLKKPITVSRRTSRNGAESFNLVCGQGRLEAFLMLQQTEIPAFVIDLAKEDCFVMSLVENLARRHHSPLELLRDIGALGERGYDTVEIAEKTGLSSEYVRGILRLLHNGEERLLSAVERNQIPLTVALQIAKTSDGDMQNALTEAYERNELRGNRLHYARRIVQLRQLRGKGIGRSRDLPYKRTLTAKSMVRAYTHETERQRAMIKKADVTEHRLFFILAALRELFEDENFVTLLRAEGLDTVPRQIADILKEEAI
jgi:ParB family chromosome partitioning protein